MPTYTGMETAVGVGVETTWGTAVARTIWLRVLSCTLQRRQVRVPRGGLSSKGAASHMRRKYFLSTDQVEGEIRWEMGYSDGSVLLLAHALYGIVDAGAGPYTHTATIGKTAISGGGLTIEVIKGNGDAEVFEGCKIDRLSLSMSPGGIMIATASIIGQTSGGLVSAGSPTYTGSDFAILHSHSGTLTKGAISADLQSFDLTFTRNLARRQLTGSTLTQEPLPSDYPSVECTVGAEYGGTAAHAAFLAGTEGNATITWTDSPRIFALTLHNAIIQDLDMPIDSPGVLSQRLRIEPFSDGTSEGMAIVVTNANALYTSNG